MTWFTRGRKSIIESSTSSRFFANFAISQPDLESRVDREEEFGWEFFAEALFCLENRLVGVHHVRKGFEALDSNA
jgi:hypothetical protein